MTVYYNEIDRYVAAWLRNLIDAGHIARGVVDERSIEDVHPSDLDGFTQCHFFAGVGVWSLALRRAGWPDDRPVWTGSCPCQPFSAAGAGAGFDDERHLWPFFHYLIEKRRPPVVLGEQVASRDAEPWIDLVQDDLEGLGYAVGAVPFPSAGVGAPHIRDRLYWVAHADHAGLEGRSAVRQRAAERLAGARGVARRLADTAGAGRRPGWPNLDPADGLEAIPAGEAELERRSATDDGPSPVNGFWRASDWLACTDAKWRPVEPGSFPLAHGAPARVGRLRAYGNAINAYQAQVFIESVMESIGINAITEAA